MELSFSELRVKEVVNTQDGKKLGRVCDLVFCYPENKVLGLVVPGGRAMFKKEERFVPMKDIVRIGEDVILVNLPPSGGRCPPPKGQACPVNPPPPKGGMGDRRSYEEYE